VYYKREIRPEEITCISLNFMVDFFQDFYYDARSGEAQLAELFKVSEVTFENSRTDPVFNKDLNLEQNEVSVTAAKSANSRCPRCRLYVSLSSNSLCSRCSNVIKDLNK